MAPPKPTPGANLTDGSFPMTTARAFVAAAQEQAQVFWPNAVAGALIVNGAITIEVRALEPTLIGQDLSATGVFNIDNTLLDVRQRFQSACPEATHSYFGNVRLATVAPQFPPATDVTPEEPEA